MDAMLVARESLLSYIERQLVDLVRTSRIGFDRKAEILAESASLSFVELMAVSRMLHELIMNPPPRRSGRGVS